VSTETEVGWQRLEEALAVSLQLFGDKEMLILERRGGGRYLQVYANGDASFHVEVSANQFLPAEEQLDWLELGALRELGWQLPRPGGLPNHHQEVVPAVAAAGLARLATETLKLALGMANPQALQYRAFDSDGHLITLPLIGQAGVLSVEEAAPTALCCPHCGGTNLDLASTTTVLARRNISEAPATIAPPRACRDTHCGVLFFPDGRYLTPHGSRSTDVPGWTHILAIDARDLERAELGSDGVLCLANLGGSDERFLSVPAQEVPKMAGQLRSRLQTSAEPADVLPDENVGEVLVLVRRAFAEGVVTGRADVCALLVEAGIPFELFSWP
jgi:hypothetical protein